MEGGRDGEEVEWKVDKVGWMGGLGACEEEQ